MALLVIGFVAISAVGIPYSAAATETDYVLRLVGLLDQAGESLTRARVALNLCLANQDACTANSEPYRDQIRSARLGVDSVRARVSGLEVPPKYVEVQGMALESLANISVALDLLNLGLADLDPTTLELASIHLDSARLQIAGIYDRLQASPPSSDSSLGAILWPVVAVLAAVVTGNFLYVAHATRRDTSARKRAASQCPRCGSGMTEYETYPLKTVEAWLATHTSTYHATKADSAR